MLFFGAFTLLVLPLFLVISARMIAGTEFGKSFFGKVTIFILYLFTAMSWLAAAIIFFRALGD